MTGRSIANDWKPLWNLALSVLALGLGARFLHFALYEAHFVSLSDTWSTQQFSPSSHGSAFSSPAPIK